MAIFEVPVMAIVEAADAQDAVSLALGDESAKPGRFLLGQADADQARQMNAEEAAARLEFIGELNAALATPRHLYQVDPGHPNVRLSPAAAHTLRRLRGEGGELTD